MENKDYAWSSNAVLSEMYKSLPDCIESPCFNEFGKRTEFNVNYYKGIECDENGRCKLFYEEHDGLFGYNQRFVEWEGGKYGVLLAAQQYFNKNQ